MISRRTFLAGVAVAAPSLVAAQQPYPSGLVKLVVPFGPGGEPDVIARQIADRLSRLKGYKIIVENKPGAGGNLGTEAALREASDGYTLLLITGSYVCNAIAYRSGVHPIEAIRPIVQVTHTQGTLVVPFNSRFRSLSDLIAAAKVAPGEITYGSGGVGSLGHFSGEYFADIAGIRLKHVPYRSGLMNDLLAGHIDMLPAGISAVLTLAKQHKVRVLVVSWPSRLAELPDVPTVAEAGIPDLRVDLWQGLAVAQDVPSGIVATLNRDVNEVLAEPDLRARLSDAGITVVGGSANRFQEVIRADFERWKEIASKSNIRIE